MVIGGRARTTITEMDLSDRVPGYPGVYGAIALDTRKGPWEPYLVTSDTDFLQRYTVYEKVQVGESLSLYEALFFLEKNNKLWVVRAENGAKYGGCLFAQDKPYNNVSSITFNSALSTVRFRSFTKSEREVAQIIWRTTGAGEMCLFVAPSAAAREITEEEGGDQAVLPTGLEFGEKYYLIPYEEESFSYRLARSQEQALLGEYIEFRGEFSGNITLSFGNDLANTEIVSDITAPSRYLMNTSDGRIAGVTSTFTVDLDNDQMTVSRDFYESCQDGDEVILDGKPENVPTVATGVDVQIGDVFFLIKVPQEGVNENKFKVQLARTANDAYANKYINFQTTGSGLGLHFGRKAVQATVYAHQIDIITDTIEVSDEFYRMCQNGDQIQLTSGFGERFPSVTGESLSNSGIYYLIKGENNMIYIARTPADVMTVTPINITNVTTDANYYFTIKIAGKVDSTDAQLDLSNDSLLVGETFYSTVETGYTCKVWSDGTLPKGLEGKEKAGTSSANAVQYYVIKTETPNVIMLATSKDNAELGVPVDVYDGGEVDTTLGMYHHIQDTHNSLLTGLAENCLLIATKTPTSEPLYVTLQHYPYGTEETWTEADKLIARTLQEPWSFMLTVYKQWEDGSVTQAEKFLMSRKRDAKDGSGTNIYCEDVAKRSRYITLIDNPSVSDEIYPCNQPTMLKLAKGYDGDTAPTNAMISAIQKLANTRRYTCTLIMDGGYSVPAYQTAIISLCENRQWTVGILSTPLELELSANYLEDLVNYRQESLNVSTSHAALYSPHLQVYDKFNNRQIFVSPTGHVAGTISEIGNTSELWFPAAGNRRGNLSVMGLSRIFEDADEDVLYDNQINPIDSDITKGIRIWGQKTLYRRNSALDRLNVRLLLCVIEPALKEYLDDFLFEINDEITRSLITAGVNSYMEGIKSRRGVYDYNFICDESINTEDIIDSQALLCYLFIQPTKVIEFVQLSVIITPTGSSMSLDLVQA